MTTIVIADTPAAVLAAENFAQRTNVCVQEALAVVGHAYCPCAGCISDGEAEAAAEVYAEGAWLRWAEGGWDQSGHVYSPDCPCC